MWVMAVFAAGFLLLLGWLWWVKQEAIQAQAQQLEELIKEARMVSQNMEAMLTSAVDLSRRIIDEMDMRMQSLRSPTPELLAHSDSRYEQAAKLYKELPDKPQVQTQTPEMQDYGGQVQAAAPPGQPVDDLTRPYAEQGYEVYRQMHPTLAVNQLYKQGMDAKQISQILQMGHGEVLLILNLARKKADKAT